jgi:hypothetical protein
MGLFALLSTIPAFNAPAEEGDDPLAKAPTQYSADMVITRKTRPPVTIHVYADGSKRRTDQESNGGVITILRGDLSMRYTLLVSRKTYMEMPLDPKTLKLQPGNASSKRIKEKVGTEEVNGELCDKYRLGSDTGKTPEIRQPGLTNQASVSGFIWIGQSTHMMVKTENANSAVEWKNIKLGQPDASVFEIPADYKKSEQSTPAAVKPESPSPAPSPADEQNSNNERSGTDKSGDENK